MKTGGCACGAVRYEVTQELTQVTFCHCSKCRRWHGHVGAYAAVDRIDWPGGFCRSDIGWRAVEREKAPA